MDFNNTKIAFASRSDSDLRRAWLLFKTLASPTLVKTGNALTNWAIKASMPVNWIIKPTIYSHFVGGETLPQCQPVVNILAQSNVKAILDYSVEGGHEEAEIEKALSETLRSIKNAGENPNIPFAVFKPTAFGNPSSLEKESLGLALSVQEQDDNKKFRQRVLQLCQAASNANVPILIDAEDSWYQPAIDATVEAMMQTFNTEKAIVFNTLQMYRHDRLAYLQAAHQRALNGKFVLGVKFVRGAYMEKERERALKMNYPSPIQPDKASTDRDFDAALTYCAQNLGSISVFCGTHNENSCMHLVQLMQQNAIAKDDKRIWFSQLYGMSDHISFNLANAGFNVAKYVPYGPVKHVVPYLSRRAEENTSVAGQTGRELRLIETEQRRRKSTK
jgi:proline dehydrogenase